MAAGGGAPGMGRATDDASVRVVDHATRAGNDPAVHLPFKYLDDRGEPFANDRDLTIADARAAGVDKAAARRAMRPASLLVVGCLLAGLAGAFGAVTLVVTLERHMPKAAAYAIAMAACTLAWALVAIVVEPPPRRVYRRGWLGLGLCPSCAYCIAELEPQEDGCRVCPECGSAWRLDVPGSPPPS